MQRSPCQMLGWGTYVRAAEEKIGQNAADKGGIQIAGELAI